MFIPDLITKLWLYFLSHDPRAAKYKITSDVAKPDFYDNIDEVFAEFIYLDKPEHKHVCIVFVVCGRRFFIKTYRERGSGFIMMYIPTVAQEYDQDIISIELLLHSEDPAFKDMK